MALQSYELLYDEGCPSAIDVDSATGSGWAGGFTFWVGNRDGQVYHVDTRHKGAKTSAVAAHSKKVTTISLIAAGGPYLSSSSGDSTVKLWDCRKLPMHTATGGRGSAKQADPLTELEHGASVTSAYFNGSGTRLVSCSNDNKLRVFDVQGGAASSSSASTGAGKDSKGAHALSASLASGVYHNNHTGRWLSPFKCVWDPNSDDTYLIGNMGRGVDLYSAAASASGEGKAQAMLGGELLTAVPTQVAAHPSLPAVVGGTASGRVYMWT